MFFCTSRLSLQDGAIPPPTSLVSRAARTNPQGALSIRQARGLLLLSSPPGGRGEVRTREASSQAAEGVGAAVPGAAAGVEVVLAGALCNEIRRVSSLSRYSC